MPGEGSAGVAVPILGPTISFLSGDEPPFLFNVVESLGLLEDSVLVEIANSLGLAANGEQAVSSHVLARLDDLFAGQQLLYRELGEALNFTGTHESLFPNPLEKLAKLLLDPLYIPGEPCRAAPPLLRDLLDIALGRTEGGVDAIIREVDATAEDHLLPAFGTAEELARNVQSILDDPITAALNMVLGQQAKIECGVDASLGVGFEVIQTGIEKLEAALWGLIS